MQIHVSRESLARELGLLSGIVERRTTIPILSHVLLSTDDDGLHLSATNLDVSLATRCEGTVRRSGGIAIQAKKLTEIVRSLPDEEIELEEEEPHSLTIRGQRSRFRIRGLDPENFPTLPEVEGETSLSLPLASLKRMIGKVISAVSSDDSRFQLNGALFKLGEGRVALVATDGYRLSLVESPLEGSPDTDGVLVPRKALQELLRFEGEDAVSYRRGEHHLSFTVGPRELTCRILEGTFPDYERVVAQDHDKHVTVSRQALISGIQRVALLTGERGRAVRFSFAPSQLVITAANPDLGDAMEQVACVYDGPEIQIGLNPDYVIHFLSALEVDDARLELKDADSQCVGKPATEEEEGGRFLSVIMPMRV